MNIQKRKRSKRNFFFSSLFLRETFKEEISFAYFTEQVDEAEDIPVGGTA